MMYVKWGLGYIFLFFFSFFLVGVPPLQSCLPRHVPSLPILEIWPCHWTVRLNTKQEAFTVKVTICNLYELSVYFIEVL